MRDLFANIFCFLDLCLGGGLRGVHILGLGMLDAGSAWWTAMGSGFYLCLMYSDGWFI